VKVLAIPSLTRTASEVSKSETMAATKWIGALVRWDVEPIARALHAFFESPTSRGAPPASRPARMKDAFENFLPFVARKSDWSAIQRPPFVPPRRAIVSVNVSVE